MTTTSKTIFRVGAALTLGVMLSGCNYNKANDAPRGGPQAVHPSPSALAQGGQGFASTQPTVVAMPAPTCGGYQQSTCYKPRGNDGSRPIID